MGVLTTIISPIYYAETHPPLLLLHKKRMHRDKTWMMLIASGENLFGGLDALAERLGLGVAGTSLSSE